MDLNKSSSNRKRVVCVINVLECEKWGQGVASEKNGADMNFSLNSLNWDSCISSLLDYHKSCLNYIMVELLSCLLQDWTN